MAKEMREARGEMEMSNERRVYNRENQACERREMACSIAFAVGISTIGVALFVGVILNMFTMYIRCTITMSFL